MLRKSLFFSATNKYLSLLIQLVSLTVIARVLTPEEIGIYSITASLFGFLLLIRDFGLGSYLIQVKELTASKASSAFTLSLVICWSLAALCFSVKGLVADFYAIEEMVRVLEILVISLLLIPFGMVSMAVIKRSMEYHKIMIIDLTSNLTSTTVTISCGLNGLSFMSLAYGSAAGTLATVLMALLFRKRGLLAFPLISDLKETLSFGWRMSGSNAFNQINTSSQDLILGKTQGPIPVVYFNRANSIFKLFDQLFVKSILPVLQSYLAKENREDQQIKTPLLKFESYYLLFAWPFCLFMFFHTEAFILLLFGNQWLDIAPLADIMCLTFALLSIFKFYPTAMVSIGLPGRVMRLSIILALLKISILLLLSAAELIFIVAALLILPLVKLLIIKGDIEKTLNITKREILNLVHLPAIIVVALAVLNLTITSIELFDQHSILHLFTAAGINGIFWLFLVLMSNHELKKELQKLIATAKTQMGKLG